MNSLPPSHKRCLIAGGGPAGVMLGFLLARAGVDVLVLEKHADFLRDFRGDTIHPSTLELMHELGLLGEFLQRPHQEVLELRGVVNGHSVPIADFSHLPTHCKFIAFMPQWDFLNFLSEQARRFPSFELGMEHEIVDLIFDRERVIGARVKTPSGFMDVGADLVVGCDGRSSIVRDRAGFKPRDYGAPIDVLWMRISKREPEAEQTLGFFRHGDIRRDFHWRCPRANRGEEISPAPLLADNCCDDNGRDYAGRLLRPIAWNRLHRRFDHLAGPCNRVASDLALVNGEHFDRNREHAEGRNLLLGYNHVLADTRHRAR
jgi:2-polyprenyl-6-methoxyphenol hydroxylase-like FAD-dependent oxidoreductase